MPRRILQSIRFNLKWVVLLAIIASFFLFIKSHNQDTKTQIFSLGVAALGIYYFVCLEKGFITAVKQKISETFFIPVLALIIIFFGYFSAFSYYQKKYPIRDLNENLVLCLDLEEGRGDTIYDKSPQKNDGKIHGEPKWAIGKKGLALEFDGIDSYINLGQWEKPFTDKNYTISVWVYIKEFPENNASNYILWRNDDAPGIIFNKDGTVLHFYVDGNQGESIALTTVPDNYINKWNYLAMSYNGTTEKIYINGELKGKKKVAMINYLSAKDLMLAWDGTKDRNIKGKLDEIKIFNRALNDAEIKTLYLGKKNPFVHSSLFRITTLVSLIILIIAAAYLELFTKKKNE